MFFGEDYIVRQNLEKNIEKVVAVTLSLGMVAINTCSNSNYSNKTVFSSNFKNENIVYATELSESEKMVPTPAPEEPVEIKNLSKKIDKKKVSKSNEKKKINSLSVVPVKQRNVDLEKKEDIIEEASEPENEIDNEQWDKLIAEYEQYETQSLDLDAPVGDIDEPGETPASETDEGKTPEQPSVTDYDLQMDHVEEKLISDESKSNVETNSTTNPEVPTETEPDDGQEKIHELLEHVVPTIVKTPFGNHLELVKKSDTNESLTPVNDLTEVQNQEQKEEKSESLLEEPIEIQNESPEMTITVYDEKQAFLDSIPEEGINGYTKATICAMIALGIPLISVTAIIGVPWIIQKFKT